MPRSKWDSVPASQKRILTETYREGWKNLPDSIKENLTVYDWAKVNYSPKDFPELNRFKEFLFIDERKALDGDKPIMSAKRTKEYRELLKQYKRERHKDSKKAKQIWADMAALGGKIEKEYERSQAKKFGKRDAGKMKGKSKQYVLDFGDGHDSIK